MLFPDPNFTVSQSLPDLGKGASRQQTLGHSRAQEMDCHVAGNGHRFKTDLAEDRVPQRHIGEPKQAWSGHDPAGSRIGVAVGEPGNRPTISELRTGEPRPNGCREDFSDEPIDNGGSYLHCRRVYGHDPAVVGTVLLWSGSLSRSGEIG